MLGTIQRQPRVFVLTKSHNERINLPLWTNYYGSNFGLGNLYILDHSSTDGSTTSVPKEVNIIRVPRDVHDPSIETNAITGLFTGLLNFFDMGIYSDTDEILVPDPNKYENLRDYCGQLERDYVNAVGLEIRHLADREPPIDLDRPILGQRRFARFSMSMSKPLIARKPLRWKAGFHTSSARPFLDVDLYLFHLKYMDQQLALERLAYTRSMEWSEQSLRASQGAHQRMPDEQMLDSFRRDCQRASKGLAQFDFAEEAKLLASSTLSNKGIFKSPSIGRKLVKIPKRFYGLI